MAVVRLLAHHIVIAALLIASGASAARCQDEKLDPDSIATLERSILERRCAGNYAQAAEAATELADLREEVQGASPWEAVDARRLAAMLASFAELEPDDQRSLAEADAVDARIEDLDAASKFADAIPLAKRQLELRKRVLGERHLLVADSMNNLATLLDRVADYPGAEGLYRDALEIRRAQLAGDHPLVALSLSNLAEHWKDCGRLDEAERMHEQALEMRRRLFGDSHPSVFTSMNNLAAVAATRGDYARAEKLHREALAIARRVHGEEHRDVALALSNLAELLDVMGRHEEAQPLCEQALAMRRRILGEEHEEVAISLNNLASLQFALGDHGAAKKLNREALRIYRKVFGNEHPSVAASLSNLGSIFHAEGDYVTAEPLWREAAVILRKTTGDHPELAVVLNNLANLLYGRREYTDAEPFFREAIAIQRKWQHPELANTLSNLAVCLHAKGNYRAAESLYREALEVARKVVGEEHPLVATILSDLATLKQDQGSFPEAEAMHELVLKRLRARPGDQHEDLAYALEHFARLLDLEGKYARGEATHREALSVYLNTTGENELRTVSCRRNTATCLHAQGKYAEAEAMLTAAARGFQAARLRVSTQGLERVAFAAEESPVPFLAACLARNGKVVDAWNQFEVSRAQGLLDAIAARSTHPPAADERKHERGLAAPQEVTAGVIYEWQRVQAQLARNAALIGWLDLEREAKAVDAAGDHWAFLLRHEGPPVCVKLPGTGPAGAWTDVDNRLIERVRNQLATNSRAGERDELLRKLYEQRLAPLKPQLTDVVELIVIAGGKMAGIPLEALTNDHVVSYAPSGTLFCQLTEQQARVPPHRQSFLGLADPVFPPDHLLVQGEPKRSSAWAALPHSRREVERLAQILANGHDQAEPMRLLLGTEASKLVLDELAVSDRLRAFRFLHFATHASMDDERPFASALILSPDRLPDPAQRILAGEDRGSGGRLTAQHILATWTLDADLVTLSACETGVGRLSGGEGYVGFSQALLVAGARSLLLSLWKVDDLATALLMTRFYDLLVNDQMSKADALHAAKQWLRALTADQVSTLCDQWNLTAARGATDRTRAAADTPEEHVPFASPFFWAAFILIGDRS